MTMVVIKKKLLFLAVVGILLLAGVVLFRYLNSTTSVMVEFENISSVDVLEATAEHSEDNNPKITTVTDTGSKIRLKKETSYSVEYTGTEDYSSGSELFIPSNKNKKIVLKPYFSDKKLTSILDVELPQIHEAIKSKYKNISLYNIEKGRLYYYGDWYGTRLVYKGNDAFSSDALKIILQKKENQWTIATDPPHITLSRVIHPGIPLEILRRVNNEL